MKLIKKRTRRIAAMLLALAMIVTSVPQYALTASAAEVTEETAIVEEHIETEAVAEVETEVKAAEVTQTEEPEKKTEEVTVETTVTEAGTEMQQVSEDATDAEAEESESNAVLVAEGESSEDVMSDEQELGVDSDTPDEPEQMVAISVKVPHGSISDKAGRGYINYLDSFEYAIPDAEGNLDFIQYEDEGLFANDSLSYNEIETLIRIEVLEGSDFYYRFNLKDRCTLRQVTYVDINNGTSYPEADEDGIYKQENIQADAYIEATASRYFNINIEAEHAKVYLRGEDGTEEEITEFQLYKDISQIIRVEPEDGYELDSVISNSSGLNLGKYGKQGEYQLKVDNEFSMKEPTTLFVNTISPSDKPKYKVTFDFERPEDVEFYVRDEVSGDDERWEADRKEAEFTEGETVIFSVKKPLNDKKGIFVEYTENEETKLLWYGDYSDDEEGEWFWYDIEGISDDISVKISLVDIYTITFNVMRPAIDSVEYDYNGGGSVDEPYYDSLELTGDGDEENAVRTGKVKMPAGYKLNFYTYQETYGTVTASADGKEIPWVGGNIDEGGYFTYTPTSDTTITLDIKPDEFILDVDEGVAFSVYEYQYNEETENEEWKEITLSENKSIPYYSEKSIQIRLTPEDGKRYQARIMDIEGYSESYDEPSYDYIDEETGIRTWIYELETGYITKFSLRCYETIPITFTKNVPEGYDLADLAIRRFEYEYDEDDTEKEHGYWHSSYWNWEIDEDNEENNKYTARVDKDKELFFGVHYDESNYKLSDVSITSDESVMLEPYDVCTIIDKDDFWTEKKWIIYKLTPTAETTISITAAELGRYTVTVIKGENIKAYDAEYYDDTTYNIADERKTFSEIKENSSLTIYDIESIYDEDYNEEGEAPIYIGRVAYETGDGMRHEVAADYSPYGVSDIRYHIKVTGDLTIYVDAEPAEGYEVTFEDLTERYDVEIWETGYDEYEEDAVFYTLTGSNNKVTLKNNKEYRFNILPKDGYVTESVVLTDANGNETTLEEIRDEDEDADSIEVYYLIEYGNTGNVTIKANMKDAYALSFDIQSSYLRAYSMKDSARIDDKKIGVLQDDSYSFYFFDSSGEYDEQRYDVTVKESDSFTIRKDYRSIYIREYEEYMQVIVYTVEAKEGIEQLSKTATIAVTQKETKQVTLDYPSQIKYIDIIYYSGDQERSYKIINNAANVRGSMNVLAVQPVSGYDITVTMTGDSGTETLTSYRNEESIFHYYLGEITEDKTITITAQRASSTSKYRAVTFTGRNVVITDPDYKTPYNVGSYYEDGEYEAGYSYYVLRGNSISFTAEPYYGYKVQSVTARGEIITPDENGIYTFKPMRDGEEGTLIIVKTVKSDDPDDPNDPDDPDDPAKKSTVIFTCPAEVTVTVDDYRLENNQLNVETGKQVSFKASVTDESYEIKSVTVNGEEILPDTATGTYTVTVTADTEIIITTAKKQEEPTPAEKYTVRFRYPEDGHVDLIYKYRNSGDGDYSLLKVDGNYGILNVEAGTEILFQFICDEGYSATAKVNGSEVPRDVNAFSYVLTVNADTEVVIETKKNTTSETNYPTQVKVKNVSSKGELNLSKTSGDYDITLTPADADGSVLGVRVTLADSVIKASITSKTVSGRTQYYLTLEKPESSVGDRAEVTIYNTNTGEAVSGGTFTVITRAPSTEVDTSGLKVFFDGYDETETPSYTYTGSAVTPWIDVTYNGEYLEEGTDYTVKYSNNINVSTDAKPAKLTITGKGSLSGKHDYTFKITQKDIGDDDVKAGSVKVVSNAKATPILVYNGAILSKKDFDNPKANDKFSANGTITLTGKGNFKGTRTINVEVVDKNALNKINIKLDNTKNKNLAYDGTEKYPAFTVLDAKKADITNKENAYIVVYPEDIISAGTVKFTVIGIGDYTGAVTKSYKIKPSVKQATDIKVSEPSSSGYTFVSTGVTEYDPDITLKDGTWLERGKDYTLAYSNNKKAGTAKCKINFIGNYKGIKAITKEFKINQFNIADFYEDNIIITDKTSGGKPGIYTSVPYIIDNEADALVKSSEFKFTYYVDEAMTKEMKGSDGKLTSGKIWVKIEPKNAAKGNYTGTRKVSYNIRENGTDLSKAKITFEPSKPAYTGSPLTPECSVDGTSIKNNEKFNVRYLSNINKGKATVIITGADGSEYVGSKTATFTIVASDIK